ncbi:MAG: ABC transporter ATP-binding protein [Akkermansia sp.]|nr:ABC transporter ATP-binding protein [Akkermansia sp.]
MAETVQGKKQGMGAVMLPVIRRYVFSTARVRRMVVGGVVAGVFAAAASGFGLPVMLQKVLPVVFGKEPPPELLQGWLVRHVAPEQMDSVLMWGAALFIPLVMAVRGISTYLNTYLLTRGGMLALSDMRTDQFARLQWLSFSFHDRRSRGDLMTAVIQYTQNVQQGMIGVMNDLVLQPLTLVAAAAYLAYAALTSHAGAMLLGNIVISAACIPVIHFVGKKLIKHVRKALVGMNVITSIVEETLSAQREVRAFNLESLREQMLKEAIRYFNRLLIRVAAWQQSLAPLVEIVTALALSYALFHGAHDGLSLEQFSAIATAFYFCYDPVKRLGATANSCQMIRVGVEGLNDILLAKDETPEPAEPLSLPQPTPGAVAFRNVRFSYEPDTPVLKDITVSVPAGQVVALVGPSGSGKTTFINLICRFYDVDSGSVEIDGVDVRRLTRTERTGAIALVSQFAALFRGTIRENIGAGRPAAAADEVEQAASRARVDEFALQDPAGYDRMLEEGGAGLSGGQRQRVSIARAFLKNAPILILDEATSALDMKSEAAIQESLEELAKGHTTFIIAHRFSTIRMAQRILVFEHGRIVADGTHDTLYRECMLYRHLYDEQVRQAQEGKEAAC